MLDTLLQALRTEDFEVAATCLDELRASDPHNPWVLFGTARLHEADAHLEEADRLYRQLLQQATGGKLIAQARDGISRVERLRSEQRESQISSARASGSAEAGVLVLEPIAGEAKRTAAQHLAKVLGIDAYTARLQLPSRGLRPMRTGPLGEIEFFADSLRVGGVPCFCCTQEAIQTVEVLTVACLEPDLDGERVRARSLEGAAIEFSWSDVTNLVFGEIPLPGEVVDIDRRTGKTFRKIDTLDYARFCDLHLPAARTILRLQGDRYDYAGHPELLGSLVSGSENLTRAKWERLRAFVLSAAPAATIHDEFEAFAGGVKDTVSLYELLMGLETNIDLQGARIKFGSKEAKEGALWDASFALYSKLLLLQTVQEQPEVATAATTEPEAAAPTVPAANA